VSANGEHRTSNTGFCALRGHCKCMERIERMNHAVYLTPVEPTAACVTFTTSEA
jgi:hypothetical protein